MGNRKLVLVAIISLFLSTGVAAETRYNTPFGISYAAPPGWKVVDRETLTREAGVRRARLESDPKAGSDYMAKWVTEADNIELLTRDGKVPDNLTSSNFIMLIRAPLKLPEGLDMVNGRNLNIFCDTANRQENKEVCMPVKIARGKHAIILNHSWFEGNDSPVSRKVKFISVLVRPYENVMIVSTKTADHAVDPEIMGIVRSFELQ